MNSKLIKATASTIVLGATLVACAPTAHLNRPAALSDNDASNYRVAAKAHERAQKAMRHGDAPSAITAMEQAVEYSPQDAGYRKTLAELYMKAGRFVSAETTFADVVKLNPSDSKATFFVAVCQLAQGRSDAALDELATMDASVDAGDLGLAYALAGDTRRAIQLLEPAAREFTATGRVRQNLALAYALAGDWKQARLLAEQDVSPADLNNRLQQWAALASTSAPETRVAMMFGVSPVNDPGQPTRLALVPPAPAADATAEATQPAAPGFSESPPATAAAAEPAPTVAAPAAAAASSPAQASTATAAAATAAPMPVKAPVAKQASLPVARAGVRKASSKFVVQIGAYDSPALVEQGYAKQIRRFAFIGPYEPLSTTAQVNGKVYHRLSIAGFDSQAEAASLCRRIKAQGGACFVRINAGDAPVQWASRYARKA